MLTHVAQITEYCLNGEKLGDVPDCCKYTIQSLRFL